MERSAGAHVSCFRRSCLLISDRDYAGSDLLGRSTAFNLTLFFTALFGLTSSLANSFLTLCISLFFLGSAVGVSITPVERTNDLV